MDLGHTQISGSGKAAHAEAPHRTEDGPSQQVTNPPPHSSDAKLCPSTGRPTLAFFSGDGALPLLCFGALRRIY